MIAELERQADFAKQYTMQAERDVHQDVTGAAGIPDRMPAHLFTIPHRESDGMGDNVEFF
jgi:hypothetical protein